MLSVRTEREAGHGVVVGDDGAQLDALVGVPELDLPVVAARGECLAVLAEGDSPDAVVCGQRAQQFLSRHVEDVNRTVQARGGEACAVGTERQTRDRPRRTGHSAGFFAGLRIPQQNRHRRILLHFLRILLHFLRILLHFLRILLHFLRILLHFLRILGVFLGRVFLVRFFLVLLVFIFVLVLLDFLLDFLLGFFLGFLGGFGLVFAAAGEELAVRAERDGVHLTGVAFQVEQHTARVRVKDLDEPIFAAAGELLAVAGGGQRLDRVAVRLEGFQLFGRDGVPEFDFAAPFLLLDVPSPGRGGDARAGADEDDR